MTYRDLVQRVMAVKHADLELGLSRAREQEAFVLALDKALSNTSWPHQMWMMRDFDVIFNIDIGLIAFEHQFTAIKQFLSDYFEVTESGSVLYVAQRHCPAINAEIRFGDIR